MRKKGFKNLRLWNLGFPMVFYVAKDNLLVSLFPINF